MDLGTLLEWVQQLHLEVLKAVAHVGDLLESALLVFEAEPLRQAVVETCDFEALESKYMVKNDLLVFKVVFGQLQYFHLDGLLDDGAHSAQVAVDLVANQHRP